MLYILAQYGNSSRRLQWIQFCFNKSNRRLLCYLKLNFLSDNKYLQISLKNIFKMERCFEIGVLPSLPSLLQRHHKNLQKKEADAIDRYCPWISITIKVWKCDSSINFQRSEQSLSSHIIYLSDKVPVRR